jgi:hypothetical protein
MNWTSAEDFQEYLASHLMLHDWKQDCGERLRKNENRILVGEYNRAE